MGMILDNLVLVRDIGKRLQDLSQSRGTPITQKEMLDLESASLMWAYEQLSEKFAVNYFIIFGPDKLLGTIKHGNHDGLLILDANNISEDILSQFSEVGVYNSDTQLLKCTKYYISDDCDSNNTHAVLFDCLLLKEWKQWISSENLEMSTSVRKMIWEWADKAVLDISKND